MHVVSVQVGSARRVKVGARIVETGINKIAVDGIAVGSDGVEGDAVVNTQHHGGKDQAVYVYTADDYAWWEQQLGRALEPGTFGENLTVSGAPDVIRAGDQLHSGQTVLEVTAPRIPCATFAARMGETGWIRRFRDAGRSGFYCRVLEPGVVRPGDQIEWVPAPAGNVSLNEMTDDVYESSLSKEKVLRALASPIAERARSAYQAQLS